MILFDHAGISLLVPEGIAGCWQPSTDLLPDNLGFRYINSEPIESALGDLDEIVDIIEDANSGVQEISNATDNQANSTAEAIELIDDVADLAQETNQEASSVSAATQQQTASVENITDQLESLTTDTQDLSTYLNSYEVQQANVDLDAVGGGGRSDALSDGGTNEN